MKLTVLGMNGPYPAAGGATSGYLVEENDTYVLVDCGSGVLSRLLKRLSPVDLTCVCLSHLHYDHACDMLPMQYYLQGRDLRLPVYLPGEDESPMRRLLEAPCFDVKPYEDTFTVGDFTVTVHVTRHPVPCRALKFTVNGKTLVYTGDAAEGDSLVEFCRDADVLLADGAFLDRQWHDKAPHMSARMAAELAKNAGVKMLIVTHLPPSNVPSLLLDEARAVFKNTYLAACDARWEV